MATIARLTYTIVKADGSARIRSCALAFTGDKSEHFQSRWRDIRYADYIGIQPVLEIYEDKLHDIDIECELIERKLKGTSIVSRIANHADYKDARANLSKLNKRSVAIRRKIDDLKRKRFKTSSRLREDAHEFLLKEGFALYEQNPCAERGAHEEVWIEVGE